MRYFTADLHLCDTERLSMYKSRGFSNIEEHNNYIIDKLNSTVPKGNQLFILGDIGIKPGRYRQRIKCRDVWIIEGNHDKPEELRNVFGVNKVRATMMVKLQKGGGSINCFLSHYAHAFWPQSHYASAHLYGHTHYKREATLDVVLGRERRSLDVGLDSAKMHLGDYLPFSEEWLYDRFIQRRGHDDLEFYKEWDMVNT